jgi:hypothetical protein
MRPRYERSVNMRDVELDFKKEIKRYFGIQEKDAYNVLRPFNITDEVVSFDNGIKISRFINDGKKIKLQ